MYMRTEWTPWLCVKYSPDSYSLAGTQRKFLAPQSWDYHRLAQSQWVALSEALQTFTLVTRYVFFPFRETEYLSGLDALNT